MITTLARRPDAPTTLDEQPVYDELLAEWPDLYARLCQPLDDPGPDVVAGEVLPSTEALDLAHLFDDEPVDQHDAPTAPIALVPTTSIPVTGRGGRKRRAPRSSRRTA